MDPHLVKKSKFLAKTLRHRPERLGLSLDPEGWLEIDALLRATKAMGLTREDIEEVVARNDKQRFAISADGKRIRARQGHSVHVELGLQAVEPPGVLYHGTTQPLLEAIREMGLIKMGRQHVHLSGDVETAQRVGSRRGHPVVLDVDAGRMHADGHAFFLSENGVWLTDRVPPDYLGES